MANKKNFSLISHSNFTEDLFDSNEIENSKKEKITALCQLMEFDLNLEEDSKIKSILDQKILFLNDMLINNYDYFWLDFKLFVNQID